MPVELVERAADLGDHGVAGDEADAAVGRVDGVVAGELAEVGGGAWRSSVSPCGFVFVDRSTNVTSKQLKRQLFPPRRLPDREHTRRAADPHVQAAPRPGQRTPLRRPRPASSPLRGRLYPRQARRPRPCSAARRRSCSRSAPGWARAPPRWPPPTPAATTSPWRSTRPASPTCSRSPRSSGSTNVRVCRPTRSSWPPCSRRRRWTPCTPSSPTRGPRRATTSGGCCSPRHVAVLRSRLRPGGVLHCATDWPAYAADALAALDRRPRAGQHLRRVRAAAGPARSRAARPGRRASDRRLEFRRSGRRFENRAFGVSVGSTDTGVVHNPESSRGDAARGAGSRRRPSLGRMCG